MAKSAKHKKLGKQEKAKTQLKGGLNRLNKAQNVIEPKLQSKKILLREQLKTNVEGEAATKRKQTLQDVLSSLNHHNINIKTEALGGLHELITGQDDVLAHNLGRILDKIAILSSDLERSVRTENLRVAEALLTRVSEDQLQPFWHILLSHLKCSLTDINPSVRQHCLSFIMLLVSYCPNLVVTSKNIILPSVLNLISSTTTVSSSTSASPSSSKTRLKVDISDKTNQIKERIHVLSLIASCLDLQTESFSSTESSSLSYRTSSYQEKVLSVTEANANNHNTNGESFHMGLYYPFGYEDETCRKNTMSSSLDFDMNGLVNEKQQVDSRNSFLNESEGFLSRFIHSCFPILCETWVEVAPSNKPSNSKSNNDGKSKRKGQEGFNEERQNHNVSHLSKTAVEVLECIVNVMDHLVQTRKRKCRPEHRRFNSRDGVNGSQDITSSDKSQDDSANQTLVQELRKSYGQELQKYFFSCLPFSCVNESQRETMVTINLQLFHVAAQLKLIDLDKYEKYIDGLAKKGVTVKQAALVLDSMSVIRVPRVGLLTTTFMIFALQSGPECQAVVYNFLQDILSLQSCGLEESKFSESIVWNRLVPVLADILQEKKFQPGLIIVLTLIAIKRHFDLEPILRKTSKFIADSVQVLKTKEKDNWDLVVRLFYYSNCLHLLNSLEFSSEKAKSVFTSSIQVLVH